MKLRNPVLLTGILVMVIAMLWTMSGVLAELQSWSAIDQPAIAGKFLKCFVYGLVALAFALGIDLKTMLGPLAGLLPFLPSPPQTVSDETRAALNDKVGV